MSNIKLTLNTLTPYLLIKEDEVTESLYFRSVCKNCRLPPAAVSHHLIMVNYKCLQFLLILSKQPESITLCISNVSLWFNLYVICKHVIRTASRSRGCQSMPTHIIDTLDHCWCSITGVIFSMLKIYSTLVKWLPGAQRGSGADLNVPFFWSPWN